MYCIGACHVTIPELAEVSTPNIRMEFFAHMYNQNSHQDHDKLVSVGFQILAITCTTRTGIRMTISWSAWLSSLRHYSNSRKPNYRNNTKIFIIVATLNLYSSWHFSSSWQLSILRHRGNSQSFVIVATLKHLP